MPTNNADGNSNEQHPEFEGRRTSVIARKYGRVDSSLDHSHPFPGTGHQEYIHDSENAGKCTQGYKYMFYVITTHTAVRLIVFID